MAYGTVKVFPTATIASGASTSSGVPLGGKAWQAICVQVGTMSTGAAIKVQNRLNGGTYYDVYVVANSAVTQVNALIIGGASMANGGFAVLPAVGFNDIRFITSAVVSGGVSFTVVGSD